MLITACVPGAGRAPAAAATRSGRASAVPPGAAISAVPVGVSYKSNVRLAMRLCVEAAAGVDRVLATPEPRCLLMECGDSSVNLEIRLWIEDPQEGRSNVISQVLLGVWDRFHEHGIEMPFPQRDLHLKSSDFSSMVEALKPTV